MVHRATHKSFPRASGDGPWSLLRVVRPSVFPPRQRGWALGIGFVETAAGVSPAPAGMGPHRGDSHLRGRRFPRASGDGPWSIVEFFNHHLFPPRQRGWALDGRGTAGERPVSPAPAGMGPGTSISATGRTRFPRASGDGPQYNAQASQGAAFPPRQRGWARPHAQGPRRHLVSPAPAGMGPGKPVSPGQGERFPRASGDGPLNRMLHDLGAGFPPRQRGWALGALSAAPAGLVSPAPAGMGPAYLAPTAAKVGFPRASGDGPLSSGSGCGGT